MSKSKKQIRKEEAFEEAAAKRCDDIIEFVKGLEAEKKQEESDVAALREEARVREDTMRGLQRNLTARDESIKKLEKLAKDANGRSDDLDRRISQLIADGQAAFNKGAVVAACSKLHLERVRLPDERTGRTATLRIGTEKLICETCGAPLPGGRVSAHLTVNRYPDGRCAEIFLALDRARRGDLAASFAHQFSIVVSIALQYGVPLEVIVARLRHVRDESGGMVMVRRESDGKMVPAENPRTAGSLIDLIAMTLEKFANGEHDNQP